MLDSSFSARSSMQVLRSAAFMSRKLFPLQLWRQFAGSLWRGERQRSLGKVGLASDPTSESRTPPSLRIPGVFRRDHYLLSKGQKFWDAHDLKVPVLYMRGSRDHWSRPEDLEAM